MPIGFTLPLRRADGGYFETSNDLLTQIKSNFINLVSTMKGERMSNPTFGCDIHKSIFNFNNDELPNKARESVEEAVARWMPYIELEKFEVDTIDADKERQTARIYMSCLLYTSPSPRD